MSEKDPPRKPISDDVHTPRLVSIPASASPPSAPRHARRALRGPLAVALVALGGLAGGVAIGTMLTVAFRRANEPAAPAPIVTPSISPRPAEVKPRARRPPLASPRPGSPPQQERRRAGAVQKPRPARLVIDLEHSLERGTLRVWVDDDLSVETRLDSEARKKLLVLKGRKGSLTQAFAVSPGEHEIRVEVAWGDKKKTGRLVADFKPGSTRRIAAKVGGFLKKNLSLEWR